MKERLIIIETRGRGGPAPRGMVDKKLAELSGACTLDPLP